MPVLYIILLFLANFKKFKTNDDILSPPIPITAIRPTGNAVIQSIIILVVTEKAVILSTGIDIPVTKTTASTAFFSFSIPPKSEPSFIKLGGIIKVSLSSLSFDISIHSFSLF